MKLFSSTLGGLLNIHIVTVHSDISVIGNGSQCAIWFFKNGVSGIVMGPYTMIVSRFHAYGSYYNDTYHAILKSEWYYSSGKWNLVEN